MRITDKNLASALIGTSRIFVIPSGGFYGLKNSEMFKAELDAFVKQGGTLVVFAQQHGYDFSILPVPQEADGTYRTVSGYGWGEDQSCQYNSSYVDTWHQMLSGQSNVTPSLNVDGYFANYPSNASVILRRVANGQPALITYPYGNGQVIATAMYTDYAFGYGQASADEKALVRDLISWAKAPAHLPEVRPENSVSVPLQIIATNTTSTHAASVKIRFLDPNRTTILNEQTIAAAIPAGQSVTIPVTFASAATALGIYHADYILLDAQGKVLQPQREADSGRFAVSNPPTSNPYKPNDLLYNITTVSENVIVGQDVPYTVTIWNNSDIDKRLRLWKEWTHWWDVGFLEEIVVPAHGSVSGNYTQKALDADHGGWAFYGASIWVHFFEENATGISKPWYVIPSEAFPYAFVGSIGKRLKLSYPSVNVSMKTEKASYRRGETVNLNLNMQNPQAGGFKTAIKVRVLDQSNVSTYTTSLDIALAKGTNIQNLSFELPMTATLGVYSVSAEVYDALGWKIGGTITSFELPKSKLSVLPLIHSAFGSNGIVSFTIKNTGFANVSSAHLTASFKNPAGEVIWSDEKQIQNLDPGQSTTIDLSLPNTNHGFGDYKLSYALNYESGTNNGVITISDKPTIVASLDKLSYRVRETADLKLKLTNAGRFNLDNLTLSVSVPDAGFADSRTIALPVSTSSSELHFPIPIPTTMLPGQHQVDISMSLPSGSTLVQSTILTVPESSLTVGYAGPSAVTAGDVITLNIENMGGVDTTYVSERLSITDNKGIFIYRSSVNGEVLSGVKQAMTAIQIPSQTLSGPVSFEVQVKDERTGARAVLSKSIETTGLAASLQTRTSKDIYLNTESISAISNIANGQFSIDNGSLQITVKELQKTGGATGDFSHFLPKDNWLMNGMPVGIAAGPDGSLYTADADYGRILKLDSSGIASHWGSYCATDSNSDGIADQPCWAQFNGPMGLAVGPDGSVYVADTGNSRIQKFDRNGTFITTWGDLCLADSNWDGMPDRTCDGGQFYYPQGIAIGPDGMVYVADTGNNRIQKFDSNGNFISQFGSYCLIDSNGDGIPDQECNGDFVYPIGITVASDGAIYIADASNNRIEKFDGYGNLVSKWGSYCPTDTNGDGTPDQDCNGRFNYPQYVTTDADGFVYIVDIGNSRIEKFDCNGNFVTKWGKSGSGSGEFSDIYGIVVAPDGFVYIADRFNSRVQKFDSIGTYVSEWGNSASSDGHFIDPYSVAVSPDNSIFVVDTSASNIQKFDSDGNFIAKWGSYCYTDSDWDGIPDLSCDGQFAYPYGIAVGPDGSVYVTDSDNYRILKFDSAGNFIAKWGSSCYTDSDWDGIPDQACDGQFAYPYGIAVDADGFVFVTDSDNNRVQKFDSAGNFIAKWGSYCQIDIDWDGIPDQACDGGQFGWPAGIAVAPDGSVYIMDSGNYRIERFDRNGNFITAWGSYCATDSNWDWIPDQPCDGQFAYLDLGVTVASDGSVYVADSDNYRIQKFDGNGNFIAKWGGIDSSGNALFSYPEGMAVGPDGSVYVADDGNCTILKMATSRDSIETLFAASIPINQAGNVTQDYTIDIGVLNAPGKLYLQAELKNSLGQTMAATGYPFYIVAGETVLMFGTDNKIYRPNETVTITGRVENRAAADAVGLNLSLSSQFSSQDSQQLYADILDVPAGGSYPFTITTTADAEGVVSLNGIVTQNSSTLMEMTDQYEVSKPSVIASVSTPEVVGNEPFVMNVDLKNVGKIDASIHYTVVSSQGKTIDDQQLTIPAGDSYLFQYSQQILANTIYTFTVNGDINQTITRPVTYGLAATMTMASEGQGQGSSVYPEGQIAVPITITNMGLLDETLAVAYQLGQGTVVKAQETRSYFLPKGASTTDTLYYNLIEGSYQVSAMSQMPTASATSDVVILKENNADITLTSGIQCDGFIPVTVNLINIGYNNIEGVVQLTLLDSQGTLVWSGEQTVNQLSSQNMQPVTFTIYTTGISAGNYSATATLLDNSGAQLATYTSSLIVQGALFQITQVPAYQTFYPDQEATFTFKIKNIGNQEEPADLAFKAYDLIDSTRTEWLKPGEEKEISFAFIMPNDLEEKDYFADYTLTPAQGGEGAVKGQSKYHLTGINLTVEASLDKQNYAVGDTAHLTLTVNQQSAAVGENLLARINYSGYEEQWPFTLNGSQTLEFDVPLTQITGEKLLYGIYYAGGRSIHLNNIYVYKAEDSLTITADKQVYDPGNVVALEISSQTPGISGQMTLTGPGYTETFAFNGSASKSFTLPMTMTAGTYKISAQLETQNLQPITASLPIDVNGIKVKIIEVTLDKGKYAETDTITANLTMTSNRDTDGTLKTWIVDPQGKKTPAGETSIMLSSTEPLLITHVAPLTTEVSGIHRLVYQVYAGDLLVSAGSEAFDVGDAALLGLATDKSEYPAINEPVLAKVSMIGTIDANLELQLDGETIKNDVVTLNGITQTTIDLGSVSPGAHVLKAILTAGGLTSTRETSFVFGSNLPDLAVAVGGQIGLPKNGMLDISVSVMNYGKSTAASTTVSLYDGESLIDTKAVGELLAGELDTVVISWNVIGNAGDHTLKAVVDPQNTVIEFNENNNTSFANIRIPADTIPPVTTINIGTPKYIANGATIVSSSTQFTLSAVDNSSGVARTEYRVDEGAWTIYAPFSVAAEGTNIIGYRSQDNEGNSEDVKTLTVIADVTPPTGSIASTGAAPNTNNPAINLSLNCTDTESGCARMQFSNDNSTWSAMEAYAASKAWQLSSGDGVHSVYVKYEDGVGNLSSALNVSITLDTVPPMAVITNTPASPTRDTGALLIVTGSDVIAYKYQFDTGFYSTEMNVSMPIALMGLADGSHNVSVVGKDSAGNWQKEEYVTSVSWIVDITPPVLMLSTLPNGAYTNNDTMNISGSAADNTGVQGVTINDAAIPLNADGTFSQAIPLVTGPNDVNTIAADTVGNTTTDARTIILDQYVPVIVITHPADNSVTNEITTDVTGSVDQPATVSVRINNTGPLPAVVTDAAFSFPITYEYGQNTIEVTATDLAGNIGTAKRTATYDNVSPALAVMNPAQDITTNQSPILLQGTVADLTGITVTITHAGETYAPSVTNGSFQQEIAFTEERQYPVLVNAEDAAGNTSSVQRNIIYDKTPPLFSVDPVKTPTKTNQQIVTGTRELNSTVTATCPTATVGPIVYPTNTIWSVIIAGMTEGANMMTVSAMDQTGNISDPVNATIVLDTHAPVTTASPTTGTYSTALTVALVTNEPATIYYTTDGTSPTTASPIYGGPITVAVSKTIQFFAMDAAENKETVKSAAYIINTGPPSYSFTGFLSPVDNPPYINTANAGQSIPVKWRITDANGLPVSDFASFSSLTSYLVNCDSLSGNPADTIEEYTAGSSGLQYLGSGNWQFSWKTAKTYVKQCRTMVLTLGDNSTHTAHFKFK